MSTPPSLSAKSSGSIEKVEALTRVEQFTFELLARRHDDAAMRSSVRRALRPETDSYAIPYLSPVLCELPTHQQVGTTRALGMMASFLNLSHAVSSKDDSGKWINRRFGYQLAAAFRESTDKNDAIGVRLATLPMLDVEQAAEIIGGLLDRLDQHGPTQIDWLNVLRLLQRWQPNSDSSKKPAFDYYSYGE